MLVPFNCMNGFLVCGYKPLYTHLFDKDLVFTFENYVKSQLHAPLMTEIYQRDAISYLKALKFLSGGDEYFRDCSRVLKYFYKDIADMVCSVLKQNPKIDIRIMLQVEFNRPTEFTHISVELSSVINDLIETFKTFEVRELSLLSTSIFVRFNPNELESLVPNQMLALASVLSHYTTSDAEPVVLEVI